MDIEMPESKQVKAVEKTNIKLSKNLVIFGIVLVLAVGVFFVVRGQNNVEQDVAAVVNGEIITIDELNSAFASLPQEYVGTVSKQSLLEQIIQTKVIYQEAEKQGEVVSEEEANQEIQILKLSSGLTDEQFSASLLEQGITESEFIDDYAKQLTVQAFIDENFLNKIQISDDEIKEFYDDNPEQFETEERVTARHILVGDETLTLEERRAKAEELLPQLTEDNFCEFVGEFSTDTASVSACGEYSFTRQDALVEEFKALSFEQNEGEMGIADTQFGSHIIWTTGKTPKGKLTLEEVSEQIREHLKSQKGREQYDDFYEEISEDSEIEVKFTENL